MVIFMLVICYVDASLAGLGAKLDNMVYAIQVIHRLKQICTIVNLEGLNIVVAIKVGH